MGNNELALLMHQVDLSTLSPAVRDAYFDLKKSFVESGMSARVFQATISASFRQEVEHALHAMNSSAEFRNVMETKINALAALVGVDTGAPFWLDPKTSRAK